MFTTERSGLLQGVQPSDDKNDNDDRARSADGSGWIRLLAIPLVMALIVVAIVASPATDDEADASASANNCDGSEIWCDDFNNLNNWTPVNGPHGFGNGEAQFYLPSHAKIWRSRLVLRATNDSPPLDQVAPWNRDRARQLDYTSGMVRAKNSVPALRPGQAVEFKVRLLTPNSNDQAGLFPAVWASSWGAGGWPLGGEIDWLEVMTVENPNRGSFSYHWSEGGRSRLQNSHTILNERFGARWRTVRFEYGHNAQLRWYLDGRLAFSADASGKRDANGQNPFTQPIRNIRINLALAGIPNRYANPARPARWVSPGATGRLDSNWDDDASFNVDYIKFEWI